MPPKSKRKLQMQQAREAKRAKEGSGSDDLDNQPGPSTSELLPTFSDYESEDDPTFDPEAEEYDEEGSIATYAQEWVESLSRDDVLSLSILLWYLLVGILQFQLIEAAKLISRVLGRSDRTIREWKAVF